MSEFDYQQLIFAYLFKVANSLQVYLDRYLLEDELTAKQFFLMIVIGSFREESPTFKEAAERSGSSYQNVKQLALKLEKKGFVHILQDSVDRRARRLVLTQQAMTYWAARGNKHNASMSEMFEDFDQQELMIVSGALMKLDQKIGEMK